MEFNISDLLDDLKDVEIDIQPDTRASARRIKELTMKKIHSEQQSRRRGLSTFTKIVLAAAVIAALAVPVAAAAGFHFTDWLDGLLSRSGDYDSSLVIGSASNNWEISGYLVELSAENASAEGLTLTCKEWGSGEKQGTLTADDGFWLERWDGSTYLAVFPETEPASGQTKTIGPNQTVTWQISWVGSYGALESGGYRLGKTLTYTDTSGETQAAEVYAKFRIFTEDMESYVKSCKTAVEKLRTQDSYHLTERVFNRSQDDYDYYAAAYWKNGDDFLKEIQYCLEDGTLVKHVGYLLRDGKGYKLTWNGGDPLSDLASWEAVDYLNETNRELWTSAAEVYDAQVGEVYAEGDTISVLLGTSRDRTDTDKAYYSKKTYTFDADGNLLSVRYAGIPSPEEFDEEEIRTTIEVHDTSAAEIAGLIAAQNVDEPISFSWQEEQAMYPAGTEGVKTEGFANTAAQTVTVQNVVDIAQKECTLEWQDTAVVSYDESAQVWKVALGFSEDDTVGQSVYLSSRGITLLVVTK